MTPSASDSPRVLRVLPILAAAVALSLGGCDCGSSDTRGVSGELNGMPTTIDFGSVTVGLVAEQKLELSNSGAVPLGVAYTAGDDCPREFWVTPESVEIAASSQMLVTASFKPTRLGPYSGSMTVTTDGTPESMAVVLTGVGVQGPACGVKDEGDSEPCYDGPVGTLDIGVCRSGTHVCQAAGTWSECTGDVRPSAEVCNGLNDDCDVDGADEGLSPYTAEVGADQDAQPLQTVQLDGRSSHSNPGGDAVSYHWRIVSAPSGATAALSDPSAAQPTVRVDAIGDYQFGLVASGPNDSCASLEVIQRVHVLANPGIRIELSWAEAYGDVDLHLVSPGGRLFNATSASGGPIDCVFEYEHATNQGSDCFYCVEHPDWGQGNQGLPDSNPANDPQLDIDQLWGLGPEQIALTNPFDGVYQVVVGYFCSRGDYGMGASEGPVTARIKIFKDNNLELEVTQRLTQRDTWTAAEISVGSGSVSVTSVPLPGGVVPKGGPAAPIGSCTDDTN